MKKFFVIGNPIEHSLSPELHNFWIKKNKIDAVYDKIKLKESELKDFINKLRNEEIHGVNVTVPFKNKVIKYIDKFSLEVETTDSVNTIYKSGKMGEEEIRGNSLSTNYQNYHGGGEGTRTPDLLAASETLSQLSYTPTK